MYLLKVFLIITTMSSLSVYSADWKCPKIITELASLFKRSRTNYSTYKIYDSLPVIVKEKLLEKLRKNNGPVLLVTDTWKDRPGGVYEVLKRLKNETEEMGIDVVVLHPGMVPGVKFRNEKFQGFSVQYLKHSYIDDLLKAINPMAIHVATEGSLGLSVINYGKKHKLPITTAYHTGLPETLKDRFLLPPVFTEAYIKSFHNTGDGVLVPTKTIAKKLIDIGVDPNKITPWSHGVDSDKFYPIKDFDRQGMFKKLVEQSGNKSLSGNQLENNKVALTVARLSPEKNIEAFITMDSRPDIIKIVVGGGIEMERLQELSRGQQVLFTGPLFGKELNEVYNLADVFVFPSKADTFGLVQLEALATGTPVAAYPVQGPIDVLTDSVGAMNDDLAFATELALLKNPEDCRNFALENCWEKSALQFLDNLKMLETDDQFDNIFIESHKPIIKYKKRITVVVVGGLAYLIFSGDENEEEVDDA